MQNRYKSTSEVIPPLLPGEGEVDPIDAPDEEPLYEHCGNKLAEASYTSKADGGSGVSKLNRVARDPETMAKLGAEDSIVGTGTGRSVFPNMFP